MDKRIFIVEDNQDDLIIAKRYLSHAGYAVVFSTADATEGVRKAVEEKPDLVILDTLLPGATGFEVCQQIRQGCGGSGPKIIITTGSIDAVDAVKARKMGADDYCAKTSDCAPLLEAVKRIFNEG